jgi:PAS domain-containing protein
MTAHAQSRRLDLPLLQSLIDALPDPCLVIDRDCTVIAVNLAWDELTRQRFNSATGSFTSVGSNYFAISRSTCTERGMTEVRAGIESVLSGTSQNFEQEYLFHNQDTFRWYRTMVRPWPLLGARAVIFHREITAENSTAGIGPGIPPARRRRTGLDLDLWPGQRLHFSQSALARFHRCAHRTTAR